MEGCCNNHYHLGYSVRSRRRIRYVASILNGYRVMPFLNPLLLKYCEGEIWMVGHDFTYHWTRHDEYIIVPEGYKTDLASVPNLVLPILVNDTGNIARPSVVHDYGYTHLRGSMTKRQVDLMFRDAMLEADVPRWRAYLAWTGVRLNLRAAFNWDKGDV